MATTAAEIEFLARVDIAERVGVLIERMALSHGEAPVGDEYLSGAALAELLRDDEPAAPALVPCDGCNGAGFMWAGTGEEMAQGRVTCVACGGEGEVAADGEEPAPTPAEEAPFDDPEPPTPAAPT